MDAQPTIAADRPGLGTGAFVLERGTIQFEAGGELASDDGRRRVSVGQVVVRWGLPFVELQTLGNSFVVSRSTEAPDGFEDLGLAVKAPPAPST